METFELRYFVEVAKHENVNHAARDISVSPGSLSKAVARLESELGVKLFERLGRNIRLTSYGKILQARAAEILRLEESVKVEIRGHDASFQVRIAGPEVLLTKVGIDLVTEIRKRHPLTTFDFLPMNEEETIHKIMTGQAHLGLTTSTTPSILTTKKRLDAKFLTCVGPGHPLFSAAKSGKVVPVAEVLQHEFVCPERFVLGHVDQAQSADGWRDDKFQRKIGFVTESLNLIENLVSQGRAIAYLPDYLVERLPVKKLDISGCPYTCKQTVKLVAKSPEDAGWMNELF